MQPCMLIIEQESLLAEGDLASCTAGFGGVRWERVRWREDHAPALGDVKPDLLLLETSSTAQRARSLLGWAARQGITTPSLAVLPETLDDGVVQEASRCLDDFVLWPARRHEVRERLSRLLKVGAKKADAPQARLAWELGLGNLVGHDAGFQATVRMIPRIAASTGNVLVTGETGTGKELCARAIHHLGPRRHGPFIAVDCGAVPEHVFENEMFGHAPGAFTDARGEQRGLAAMAEGGTLFLDEVDNLAPSSQAKLLRFLQERSYRPLGSDRFRQADARIVAATNRDLEACVAAGRFRGDLFFRLNVLALRLTPLRERPGDIALLAQHFLEQQPQPGEVPRAFSPEALQRLSRHHWPGNVRELLNVVQRAVVFATGAAIDAGDLALPTLPGADAPTEGADSFRSARAQAMDRFERSYVSELLRRHGGNITHAAREAKKDRRAFGRLVKRLGLARGDA